MRERVLNVLVAVNEEILAYAGQDMPWRGNFRLNWMQSV